VAGDLAGKALSVPEAEIRRQIRELMVEAKDQIMKEIG